MDQQLIETIADGVATLTLNRPDRLNALSAPIMDGLSEALPRLAADSAVGVVVLTGAGRAFCAGGDVKRMADEPDERSAPDAVARLRARMEISRLLHEIPKVTIAMVNGPAAGAGLAMALACDLRIAAESARFVTAFAKVGFSGDFGGSYFLSKLVGTGKARELYFTAEPLDSAQALALGIVNRVVPDEELGRATMAFAARLARGPRIALAAMKQNFNAPRAARSPSCSTARRKARSRPADRGSQGGGKGFRGEAGGGFRGRDRLCDDERPARIAIARKPSAAMLACCRLQHRQVLVVTRRRSRGCFASSYDRSAVHRAAIVPDHRSPTRHAWR
jgi:2-(1,2-epoxy-1,2-dihydrophenyl)acetyl-CoA isomerase